MRKVSTDKDILIWTAVKARDIKQQKQYRQRHLGKVFEVWLTKVTMLYRHKFKFLTFCFAGFCPAEFQPWQEREVSWNPSSLILEKLMERRSQNLVNFFYLKVWRQDATLFVLFSYFITYIQSHSSVAIRWGLSPFPHRLNAQWETPPCGAELGIELGPALQQADALPTEPRRTIFLTRSFFY